MHNMRINSRTIYNVKYIKIDQVSRKIELILRSIHFEMKNSFGTIHEYQNNHTNLKNEQIEPLFYDFYFENRNNMGSKTHKKE